MDFIGLYGINSFPVFYINPFVYRNHSSPGFWQQQTVTNSRTHSIVLRANSDNKQFPRRHFHRRCSSRRGVRRSQRRDIVSIGRVRGNRSLTTHINCPGEESIAPSCNTHIPANSISSSSLSSSDLSDFDQKIYRDSQELPIIRVSPPHSPLNKRSTALIRESYNLSKNNSNNNKSAGQTFKKSEKQSTLEISESSIETPPRNVHDCGLLLLTSHLANEKNSRTSPLITEILSEFNNDDHPRHTGHIECGQDNGSLNNSDNIECCNHHNHNHHQHPKQQQDFDQYSVSPTTAAQRCHILSLIKEEEQFEKEEEEKKNKYNLFEPQQQEDGHNSGIGQDNCSRSTFINSLIIPSTSIKHEQEQGNDLVINSSISSCCEQKSKHINKNDDAVLEFWLDDSSSESFDNRTIKDTGFPSSTQHNNFEDKSSFESMYFQLASRHQISTTTNTTNDSAGGFGCMNVPIQKPSSIPYFESESHLVNNIIDNNKDFEMIACIRQDNDDDGNNNEKVNIIKEKNNIINESRYNTNKTQTMDVQRTGNGNLANSYSVISECSSEHVVNEIRNPHQVASTTSIKGRDDEVEEIVKKTLDFSDSCDADDESSVSFSNIRPPAIAHYPHHHHRLGNKNHSFDLESKPVHHHNHHSYHHLRSRKISRIPSMDCPVLPEDKVLPTSNNLSGVNFISSEDHLPLNNGVVGKAVNPKLMAMAVSEDSTLDELSRSCSCPQDVNTIYKRLSNVGLHDLPHVKHSLEGATMFRRQGSDRRSKRRAADHHRQRKKGISTMEMSTLDLLTVFEAASRNTPSRLSLRLKDNNDKDVSLFTNSVCFTNYNMI